MQHEKQGKDYQVSVFWGNRMWTCLLSDILKSQKQSQLWKSIGVPENFCLCCAKTQQAGKLIYDVSVSPEGGYSLKMNGEFLSHKVIASGDYLVFINSEESKTVKMQFISTSDLRVGYKKYELSRNSNYFIGRSELNEISFGLSNFISREHHAAIRVDQAGKAFLEDLQRSVGIYVNGHRVYSHCLQFADEIFMMGLSIVYLGSCIAVRNVKMRCTLPVAKVLPEKSLVQESRTREYFVNPPRILWSLDSEEMEVDAPPAPFLEDKTPALLLLGPSLTMGAVTLASTGMTLFQALSGGQTSSIIASGTMAGGMLAGSLLWPNLLRRYQKKKIKAEEANRLERYTAYIEDIDRQIAFKKERTMRILNDNLCPAPDVLCSVLDNEERKLHLWERSCEDNDFLDVRLGLGYRPFDVHLKVPKTGFQLYEDPMRKLPDELGKKYCVLRDAPLTLNLRDNRAIGVIGDAQRVENLLNQIILNIIALHIYSEVKLVFITDKKHIELFQAYENLPHVWSNDKKTRFLGTTEDEVHHIFNAIAEEMDSRRDNTNPSSVPHYVILITEPELVERESFLRVLDAADSAVSATAVYAYGDIIFLPKNCRTIIQCEQERSGYYSKNQNQNRFIEFTPDAVDPVRIHEFARKLMKVPVKRDARMLGIADRITFLQMYKAGNVEALDIEHRWSSSNVAKSLAAPIGVMAGGEIFSLDIHEAYHGCHGLVAGTTGSGKSEFLQEYILSLAVNYSPEEVSFVLVDFKGGDMARPFMKKAHMPALPHLAATISNLSGNILYRALVSLDAEIRSRQRIFNEAAASLQVDKLDINSYQKYRKSGRLQQPLPHLIVIIDEFAQLKTQRPDFLEKLINIAQVGRSLGIHLILATQKPSGVVDPQIQSNSRFKVCLKVAEKQDSMEMVNTSDAAMIHNPGRMCLQVGYNEIYEQIQSGYSGAEYVPTGEFYEDDEITVHMVDHTASPIHSARIDLSREKSDRSQLEAVVEKIVLLGQQKQLKVKPLWLEPLPERILLSTLTGRKGIATATLGLADFVHSQQQLPLTVDFTTTGNLALYGAAGTGKTTFLQTLVYSMVVQYGYTPAELSIYAMDFAGRNLGNLAVLPHTGDVIFAEDGEKISRLCQVLKEAIDERKRLFASAGCGSFREYRTSTGRVVPVILVLIDNYAVFHENYMDFSGEFQSIIAEGNTFGVYFVITGSTRNAIHYRVMEHIGTVFTLCMNDPNSYLDILNVRPPVIPENIGGRGILVVDRQVVEFQTALACGGESDAQRTEAILSEYRRIARKWEPKARPAAEPAPSGAAPAAAPRPAAVPAMAEHPKPDPVEPGPDTLVLAESRSGVLTYGMSLKTQLGLCICADGMEDLCRRYQAIFSSLDGSSRLLIIDDSEGSLEGLQSGEYVSSAEQLEGLLDRLKPILNSRLSSKDSGGEKLFIVISEFNRVFRMITDEQAAFLRKLCRFFDSTDYGIYFLCGFDVNGPKSNDSLFLSLVVHADSHLLGPGCYEKAASRLESLPAIRGAGESWLIQGEKYAEIGW